MANRIKRYSTKNLSVIDDYDYKLIDAKSFFINEFGNIFSDHTIKGNIITFSYEDTLIINDKDLLENSKRLKDKLDSLKEKYKGADSAQEKQNYEILSNFDARWLDPENLYKTDDFKLIVWGIKTKYIDHLNQNTENFREY